MGQEYLFLILNDFTDYSLTIVAEIYIIFRSELIRHMNSGPYSLGTNGSNDESGIKKLNPVLICLFDDNKGPCKEGTAEVLFNNIDSKVNWEGRLGILCCCWAGQHSGEFRQKESHHDTGIGEEQKYVYKWLSLPRNPQHCKQSSGMIFRSVGF